MAIEWKKNDLPTLAQKVADDASETCQNFIYAGIDVELSTRQEKEAAAKKQQEHEQLPDRVAEMEDALCEQDAANEKRLTDIETALCELDAALNKE